LTIGSASASDAGVYTCQATNALGTATTSGTLHVKGDDNIISGTQHPRGESGLERINQVEQKGNKSVSATLPDGQEEDVKMKGAVPEFVVPLEASTKVEGTTMELRCEVEPKKDDKLRVNWCHNGAPLEMGSRVKAQYEFGQVTLNISGVSARDRGVYTCKAVNQCGEAVTFTSVDCADDGPGLDLSSQHPRGKQAMDALAKMEAKGQLPDYEEVEDESGMPPNFITEFKDIRGAENGSAYAEAKLEPKKDPNLKTEWKLNGKSIQESTRLRTITSFGMVVFELKSLRESDFGEYTCTATNRHGVAQSGFRLEQTTASETKVPRFTSQLKDVLNLVDGQSVHMECAYVPANDANLAVEWKVDGKQLLNSNRIKVVSDFGFAMLDISSADSRDTGKYTCTISNRCAAGIFKLLIIE
jgi:titin